MATPQYPGQPPYGQPPYGQPPYGQPPFPGQPQFPGQQTSRPGTVTAAAIMWIIYGGLGLLGNLMSLGVGVGVQTFVGFAMSLGFLITGIQALSGRAKSLLGSGIASIILGVIVLLALFVLGSMVNDKAPMAVIAAIGLAFGGMLITAGILACLGNTKFKLWRAYRGL